MIDFTEHYITHLLATGWAIQCQLRAYVLSFHCQLGAIAFSLQCQLGAIVLASHCQLGATVLSFHHQLGAIVFALQGVIENKYHFIIVEVPTKKN